MSSPLLSEPNAALVRIASGQCLLLDTGRFGPSAAVEVVEGIGRLACSCEQGEAMTIAFLQSGDQWQRQRGGAQAVCLEALTPLLLRPLAACGERAGADPVQDWTLQLLRIRHLAKAEQRLHALLGLLVFRLGRRCGARCDLPFRLSHDRLAELIGTTRVTTTRLMSQFRLAQLLEVPRQGAWMRLAPELVDSAPLVATP
jgi:hypothetical protein